jgi:hypothetical protein
MIFKKFKRDKFRRVVTGLGWPTSRPGCLVVVGEKMKGEKARYHLLAEYETSNLTDLVTYAFDFQKRYELDVTHTDLSNRAMVEYAYRIRPQLNLSSAPYAESPDNLVGYTVLLKTLTAQDRKKLHFSRSSNLPRLLMEIGPDKVRGSAGDYPFVAALGYAVMPLEINQPGGKVEVGAAIGGGPWGTDHGQLNSPAGHYLMDDSPTAQRWRDEM